MKYLESDKKSFTMQSVTYTDREWYEAQLRVAKWLRNHGLTIKHAGPMSPFALFTPNMTRIGVRRAAYKKEIEFGQGQKGWKICFGNNALYRDKGVDFYVFLLEIDGELELLGIKRAMFLVLRAPLKRYSLAISTQSLLTGKWAKNINNWRAVAEFDNAKP